MLRKRIFLGAFAVPFMCGLASSYVIAQPTLQGEQSGPNNVEIRRAILKVTGYKDEKLELFETASQLFVRLVNTPLASKQSAIRENEARRIFSAIIRTFSAKPEFRNIVEVHVEYVTREPASGKTRIIEAIHFRSRGRRHRLT